ncbi:glycoside hydrolase family 28 protein [Cylindrobasidium torrendii FP15055 ss-10]|uniref:endo-polygalacturonase n=1 Tax=Cylindrobasidium torrendii FP15055 ss-10 TaxID=1314674 RepID=A0A0D7B8N5_9AGAR|nr:glycoside hydrolase family 28 protein [Cylindrobasidium torrendii FP15055 ss-10]
MLPTVLLAIGTASALSVPKTRQDASCTISSLDDVDSVVSSCTDITINSFTVDPNTTLDLSDLADGSKVTLAGNLTWAKSTDFVGPLFQIGGSGVTFDGAGFTFDGQGAQYWDGQGSNGGVTKPKFIKVTMGGEFKGLNVLNAPVHCFSIGNKEKLVISGSVSIDNTDGDALGDDGKTLGHNSDCFDVSATDLTITGSSCKNQDDCLAVNKGSNITFSNNFCSGGHGISIGSIASDKVVSGVTISGNTVEKSTNGLRIKTIYGATGGSVSDITYIDNTVAATDYGVIIEQDYENGSPTGTPTNGIKIENVSITGKNTVTVSDDAKQVYVLCGDGSCTGTWDWSGLTVSGGEAGSITGEPPITGFTLSS